MYHLFFSGEKGWNARKLKDNAKKQRFVGKVQVIEVEIVFKCPKLNSCQLKREKKTHQGGWSCISSKIPHVQRIRLHRVIWRWQKGVFKKYSIAVLLKMSGHILSHDCFNSFLWQSKKLFKKMTPPDLEFCLALKWQANLGACFRRAPPNPILLLCHLLLLHYSTIFGPK